ncbi:hypothetical protein GH714_037935 [Hevea brasiliensis]|uniref:MCM N-terminal domain-containing protein n=1 Tax=Hevea brasiliensis TaxID=3981 RepID=A0A6A6LW84_HEVBR|nr:hypothetical protein GH714_037935 [Hevea brasiliensis]
MPNFAFFSLRVLAKDFISNFADANGEAKYMNILQDLANHKSRAVKIDFEDLLNYKDLDEEFFRRVTKNTRRYIGIFAAATDEVMPASTEPFPDDERDILMTQRSEDATENPDGSDPQQKMPAEIKRY